MRLLSRLTAALTIACLLLVAPMGCTDKQEEVLSGLTMGEFAEFKNGWSVRVVEVEEVDDPAGGTIVLALVEYFNGTDATADFGMTDWMYEDDSGAVWKGRSPFVDSELGYGSLAPGGTRTGLVGFDPHGDVSKIMYTAGTERPFAIWNINDGIDLSE